MMKSEFEALAKRTVTQEQFDAINTLYMSSTMNKQEFVRSIKGLLKSIPDEHQKVIVLVTCTDHSGYEKTPNGCWYHYTLAELVNVDIATGKIYIRRIPGTHNLTSDIGKWSTGYDCYRYWEVEEVS